MEDRSLPSREANKWQRVVLPHLSYNEAKEISRILNVMIGNSNNLPQAGEINNTLTMQTNSSAIYLLNLNKAFSNIKCQETWLFSVKQVQ